MRVFCPSCSEPINLSDDQAGKTTVCPLCKATFTAPSLFGSSVPSPSAAHGDADLTPYSLAAEPAPPPRPAPAASSTTPPSLGMPSASITSAPIYSPPPPPPVRERPLSAPAAEHARSFGFSISPEIIQWAAPVCLGIAVILTFCSWNGAYPGGYAVYTQGPWRALVGHIAIDPVGEKVLHMNPSKPPEGKTRLEDDVHMNWLMWPYLPLLFAAFALSIFFTLLPRLSIQIPPSLRQIEPWRMLVVAGLSLFLVALLGMQSARGFGLENALIERVKTETKEPVDNPSEEDIEKTEIARGQLLGALGLQRTTALELEFWMLTLAILGAAATFVMNRRTDRPAPRLELHW